MRSRRPRPAPQCQHCGRRVLRAVWDRREVLLDPAPAPENIAGFLAYQGASGAWIARAIVSGYRHPTERPYVVHALRCTDRPDPREQHR